MSRIVYISGARLPTEKAHGLQTMKMCEAIADLGHEVELLHPFRRRRSTAETDPFAYYGIRRNFRVRTLRNWDVVPLERRLPEPAFRALFAARDVGWGLFAARRAALLDPDLVYTRSPFYAYWAARLGQACTFEAHVAPTARTAPFIRSFATRACVRAVFALTTHTARDLEETGVPAHKLAVLPDAADLAAFARAPAREEARRLLSLPPRRPIIGYVGRFQAMGKEKGIADLIRAVSDPDLRRLDPLLLCVGGPMDPVPGYMALAASVGVPSTALRFVDRVPNPEVPTWLAAVDVAAMPTPADYLPTATSPMKLFEYLAAGLPIVATDLPAFRDVLHPGRNALLVPPGEPAALAVAFRKLFADAATARALGERARRDAAEHSWHRRAERALSLALAKP